MSSNTVAEFAAELKSRLKPCWINSNPLAWQVILCRCADQGDNRKLLTCRPATARRGDRKKITLTKKSTSEIKRADATGKAAPSRWKCARSAPSSNAIVAGARAPIRPQWPEPCRPGRPGAKEKTPPPG